MVRVPGQNQDQDSRLRTRTGIVFEPRPPAFAPGSFLGGIEGPVQSFMDEYDDDEDGPECSDENVGAADGDGKDITGEVHDSLGVDVVAVGQSDVNTTTIANGAGASKADKNV